MVVVKSLIIILFALLLSACGQDEQDKPPVNNATLGYTVFKENCMVCHGKAGKGLVENWQQAINGKYPAPPLNGTAHTWHHSRATLLRTINEGGVKLGGSMPGFKDKLSSKQKQAVLDYIHNLWPRDIQQQYDKRFK